MNTSIARQRHSKHAFTTEEAVFSVVPPQDYVSSPVVNQKSDLHLVFKIPYLYDYIIKLCRRQAGVILNHENPNVCATGQGEARHRKYKRLKLGGGQTYDCSSV
jgi:hypothetical protein